MNHIPNPHGFPGPILERVSKGALANEARAILRQIHQADEVLRRVAYAQEGARSLRLTTDGDVEAAMIEAMEGFDEVIRALHDARTRLDESITPEMEDTL